MRYSDWLCFVRFVAVASGGAPRLGNGIAIIRKVAASCSVYRSVKPYFMLDIVLS